MMLVLSLSSWKCGDSLVDDLLTTALGACLVFVDEEGYEPDYRHDTCRGIGMGLSQL